MQVRSIKPTMAGDTRCNHYISPQNWLDGYSYERRTLETFIPHRL